MIDLCTSVSVSGNSLVCMTDLFAG